MNTPIINESVLLCGIIKNAEKYIEKNICKGRHVNKIGQKKT